MYVYNYCTSLFGLQRIQQQGNVMFLKQSVAGLFLVVFTAVLPPAGAQPGCRAALDFHKRPLTGTTPVHLCRAHAGKVVLIVNTASRCAYTDQYAQLEALYDTYAGRGLVVLGFPSNDFGHQEPGSEREIRDFCRLTYDVSFPMYAKSRVAAPQAEPLFAHLAQLSGEAPAWNFHKYLIGRDGRLLGSFPASVAPDAPELIRRIEAAL